MKKFGNPLGIVFAIFLGIFFYFYYFHISFPITIILILIWKRKWVGRQLVSFSNFIIDLIEKSKNYKTKEKLDKNELLEDILEKIDISPNLVMSAYGSQYQNIASKQNKELFEHLYNYSASSSLILLTKDSAEITLRILEYLVEKFRRYNRVKRYRIPENFETKYSESVTRIKQLVKSQYEKKSKPKRKYKPKIVRYVPDYIVLLTKFELEERQAIILFGKEWKHFLAGDTGVLFWNIQTVISRIRSDSEYRERLYPYFESTLDFIQKIFDSNPELSKEVTFRFVDVFEWESDYDFDQYTEEFWQEYERFSQSSTKYKKFFDDFREGQNQTHEEYQDESSVSELDNAFKILDLDSSATIEQVKRRYRELTLKYHPDRNKNFDTTEKMTGINNAVDMIMEYFRAGAAA